MAISNPKQNPFAAPTMAAAPAQSKDSTYAPAATDPETLRKRRELASRLFQARKSGVSMGEAVSSETGVDVGNIQQGSVDTAMGTGLTESEIAGFAQRLYGGMYDTQKAPTPNETKVATPMLDQYDRYQNTPIGSSPMGATGGLAKGPSRTGGTPIGAMSQSDRMREITKANLLRDASERRRQSALLRAEEDAYNQVYGGRKFEVYPQP